MHTPNEISNENNIFGLDLSAGTIKFLDILLQMSRGRLGLRPLFHVKIYID